MCRQKKYFVSDLATRIKSNCSGYLDIKVGIGKYVHFYEGRAGKLNLQTIPTSGGNEKIKQNFNFSLWHFCIALNTDK
jgi:hypothetical protein